MTGLAQQLRASMDADNSRSVREKWDGESQATEDLRAALIKEWSEARGVVQANGQHDWRRLFGKTGVPIGAGLPGDDHVSIWRRPSDHGSKISIWVSQPYGISSDTLRLMTYIADERGLDYKISAWPAWHFPGSVLFFEWTVREAGK